MGHLMTIVGFVTVLGLAGPQVGSPVADGGTPRAPAPDQNPDSAAVVAVIDAFHTALEDGDTAAVGRLLSEDVVVQEGGGFETQAEYFSHHMPADMAFAAAVPAERSVDRVRVQGDVAWVASSSERSGTYRDRAIDIRGAELIVLTRTADGWHISAIHWSSRSRR